MKTLREGISVFLVLAGLATAHFAFVFSAETNGAEAKPHLPSEVKTLLQNADEFTFYSLNPEPDFKHKSTNALGSYPILGQTRIRAGAERNRLLDALDNGIANGNGIAKCFDPRHGIRARKDGETIECLICFECRQIRAWSNKGTKWEFVTSDEPAAIFNRVLKKARVPLPKN